MLLQGIFLPVLTPFYPDGRVYFRKLEHNVDRYARTPAAGMLVLGPSTQADGLSDQDAREMLRVAIAASAPEKVMIAGVGRESVLETLVLGEAAAALDYDVLAIAPPRLASDPSMTREVLTYFKAVADRTPLPIVLVTERAGDLPVDLLAEFAEHPSILGAILASAASSLPALLERTAHLRREVMVTPTFAAATGRMLRPVEAPGAASFVSAASLGGGGTALATAPPAPALRTRTRTVGFQVLEASTSAMLASFSAGASGAVPRLGVCAPQACCEVFQAFKDDDRPLAEEKQTRLAAAAARMEGPQGIAWAKYGSDLNGYFGGRPRLPLFALSGDERVTLEHEMAMLQN